MIRRSRERVLFWALVALHVALVLLLPVLPGHDLPQHLAYVRLLGGWDDRSLHLSDVYLAPDLSDPYVTSYRVLALIARHASPDVAMRIAFVAYVVLLPIALAALLRAVWRLRWDEPCATSLLAPILVWNPVVCMGFLPFFLAFPSLVGGAAAAVSFADRGAKRHFALALALGLVTATIHAVAGAVFLLLVALVALLRRDLRAIGLLAAAGALLAAALRLASPSLAQRPELFATLVTNVRVYGLVLGTVGTFRISFSHQLLKLEMALANLCGPFPRTVQIVVTSAAVALVAFVLVERWRAPGREGSKVAAVRGVRGAFVLFAILAVVAPAAIQIPDDMSSIDFRLLTVATMLALALVPPRAVSTFRTEAALAGFAALVVFVWARQLTGVAGETMQVVHLVDRLAATDRLLALPLRDSSAYLDRGNAVMHYAPVHHTARNAGLTSLFWGKFTPRLPIGYRPGAEPSHPFDWSPWELRDDQLASWTHLLAAEPEADDDERMHALAARVSSLEGDARLVRVACEGRWCLYEVPPLFGQR